MSGCRCEIVSLTISQTTAANVIHAMEYMAMTIFIPIPPDGTLGHRDGGQGDSHHFCAGMRPSESSRRWRPYGTRYGDFVR
jgi:hypothetical protein